MNIEEVKAMSNEKLNVKIAPLCGYTHHSTQELVDRYRSIGVMVKDDPEGYFWRNPAGQIVAVPDFCSDLNAMYEAEKNLNQEQRDRNYAVIWQMIRSLPKSNECQNIENGWLVYHATARQRAEAFVLAMEN